MPKLILLLSLGNCVCDEFNKNLTPICDIFSHDNNFTRRSTKSKHRE